ncbi:MAG: ABC transporter substrate-binding protein, partial [Actinomycetota bacterium]
ALTGAPAWGDAENYPWTTGILIPYDVESKAYATLMGEQFPDGANVGLFSVNNEFGQAYIDAFEEIAPEFNLTIVDEQTIEATESAPPTAQVNSIATKAPEVIFAIPLGAGCATFLSELANAKAANPGWDPKVFVTATCASSLILDLAGAAADGIYTASNLVDVLDPTTAALPAVAEYIAYMESLGKSDIITTAGAGWHTAEMTVAILKKALESGVLSRASIINAARSLDVAGSLTREGVRMKMSGIEDRFMSESLQIVQYDAETKLFTDVGSLITLYES